MQTQRESLIAGRDATDPEYRPHYVIGVCKGMAEHTRSQVWLIRQALDRLELRHPGDIGIGYIAQTLTNIDTMMADLIEVAS